MVLAYLIEYKGLSFDHAFDLLKTKSPQIDPNAGFMIQLLGFKPLQKLLC